MNISTQSHKRCTVVSIDSAEEGKKARIDTYTAPSLQNSLKEVTEGGVYNIILDMSNVDFLSSKGLWVLTETQKECKKPVHSGELVLVNADSKILNSFKMVGMDGYFKAYDDVIKAVGSF